MTPPETRVISQSDEQRDAFVEREVQRRVAEALAEAPSLLKAAVKDGMREAIDDPDLQHRYWERGYKEFERHAGANLAQAIGRRIILFVITGVVGMVLAWTWVTGRPGK